MVYSTPSASDPPRPRRPALPSRRLRHSRIVAAKTSSTTSGLLAITSTRAAASAWRLPCSYSRILAGENPNRRANAAWLQPKPARIARTSTLAGAEDHDDASQGDQEGRQCRAYVNDTGWAAEPLHGDVCRTHQGNTGCPRADRRVLRVASLLAESSPMRRASLLRIRRRRWR